MQAAVTVTFTVTFDRAEDARLAIRTNGRVIPPPGARVSIGRDSMLEFDGFNAADSTHLARKDESVTIVNTRSYKILCIGQDSAQRANCLGEIKRKNKAWQPRARLGLSVVSDRIHVHKLRIGGNWVVIYNCDVNASAKNIQSIPDLLGTIAFYETELDHNQATVGRVIYVGSKPTAQLVREAIIKLIGA